MCLKLTITTPGRCLFPANIYLFKDNNRSTRKRLLYMFKDNYKNIRMTPIKFCLNSGVFIVNFEHISYLFLGLLLLNLNKEMLARIKLTTLTMLFANKKSTTIFQKKLTTVKTVFIFWNKLFHPAGYQVFSKVNSRKASQIR